MFYWKKQEESPKLYLIWVSNLIKISTVKFRLMLMIKVIFLITKMVYNFMGK